MLVYLGLSILDGQARTIRCEITDWKNRSWGFHAIERSTTVCEVAVASNGSRANQCTSNFYRHLVVPDGTWNIRTLYLQPQNEAYRLDESSRTATGGECQCAWTPQVLVTSDRSCLEMSRLYLEKPKASGEGLIAGQRVIRYEQINDDGDRLEYAFAPERGCELFEETRTYPGALGLPGAKFQFRITAYLPGEPDPRKLQIPDGYTVKPQSPAIR
jgi:hypothetical protein